MANARWGVCCEYSDFLIKLWIMFRISYKNRWIMLLEISYKKLWTELLDCSELGISYKKTWVMLWIFVGFLIKNFLKKLWTSSGR